MEHENLFFSSSSAKERCPRLSQWVAQSRTKWEFRSRKYIKVSSSQHISHANSCLDVPLECHSTPDRLQLKIITLLLGQMKGLHQQLHGLVASPAWKMGVFLKSRSTFISIFNSQLWVCYKASNKHGNKLSSSISHLQNSLSFRKD